jgi:hypothetical protein
MPGHGIKKMRLFDKNAQDIFESHQPYQDFFVTNDKGWIVPDLDRCRRLAHYRAVIANCATEHWGNDDSYPLTRRLVDIFRKCCVENFVILTHDPGYESLENNIVYFPFWFWQRSQDLPPCPDMSRKKTFLVSSLGGQPRPFRIANYLIMQEKPYRHESIVNLWHDQIKCSAYDDGFELTQEENADWQTICRSVQDQDPANGFAFELRATHPAWTDTCLNLVNESTVKRRIFITEKTWKPILSGQLFLVLGNQGILSELRRLGFDVFDDIIDHSYDFETDARTRLNKMHAELDRIVDLDLHDMLVATRHRRWDNWIKFRDHKPVDQCLESIKNIISL